MGSRPRLVTARFSISHSAGVAVSVKHRVCRSTELTAEREEIHKSVVLHCGSFPGNCALFLCASSRVHSKELGSPGSASFPPAARFLNRRGYSLNSWWTNEIAIDPSPTPEATRLTLPPRTSPAP